ncbi:cytoplasmic polyadenylation element-binding protein 2-like isoform X2 [Centruroides vittatus]|uniref:cytoplasmic polyadenylation element-binding protein 2-like isoform X2 n=1 Tax=Centruroides vittatus TaxID=120091 RepID=UPI003510C091
MGEYNFTSSVRSLSPVDFQTNSSNIYYPTENTMQDDDLLLDKNGSKQQNQQNNDSTDENVDDYGPKDEEVQTTANHQLEKKETSTSDAQNTTITTTSTSFWSEDTFIQGVSTLNGTLSYQNFPVSTTNITPGGFSTTIPQLTMNQMTMTQQNPPPSQHRRAITGAHNFAQMRQQPQSNLFKTYTNWSSPQQPTWSANPQSALSPWNAINLANQKRSVPNLNPLSALKKTTPSVGQHTMISPSKFRRSTSLPTGKTFPHGFGTNTAFDISGADDNRDGNLILPFQDRQITGNVNLSPLDTLRFPLEQQLLDIMRTADGQDHYKGYMNYNPNSLQSLTQLPGTSLDFGSQKCNGNKKFPRGKSPFFNGLEENHFLDDGHLDQIVPSLHSPLRCSPKSQGGSEGGERYSRKVFVGGLPPDIDEEEITASFRRFGPLVVDWPHKAESKSYFPPKGYAFLLFQDESSVQALIDACIQEDDKLYLCVSSPTIKDKPVQIRPWRLSDADFVLDASMPLDPRKTVFVGGVPRPLKAVELAMIMDRLYGGVCYAGIDTDPELKYPKGAGRVAFSNQQSYIAAISARFVQLQHGDIEKRVEVKPYVLDDQMCDECQGARCSGKFAPFFCANVTCLQYYCEHCWATIHSRPGREFHKPLVKEGADRPRAVPFRWC